MFEANGEGVIRKYLMAAFAAEYPKQPYQFRISSFPYCSLLHGLHLYDEAFNLDKEVDYKFKFYTAVGTAIHETIQEACVKGKLGNLTFANWKCSSCGFVLKEQMRPKSARCPKCKVGALAFEEIDFKLTLKDLLELDAFESALALLKKEVESGGNAKNTNTGFFSKEKYKDAGALDGLALLRAVKRGKLALSKRAVGEVLITGHLDGLIKQGDKFYTLEYKSSADDRQEKYLPQSKHTVQIALYNALLYLTKDIRVAGRAIVYLGRGSPTDVESKKGQNLPSIKYENLTSDELYFFCSRLVELLVGRALLLGLERAVEKDKKDEEIEDLVDNLIANRPCQSTKAYNAYMKKGYFGKEACPYSTTCPKGAKEVRRHLTKAAKAARGGEE